MSRAEAAIRLNVLLFLAGTGLRRQKKGPAASHQGGLPVHKPGAAPLPPMPSLLFLKKLGGPFRLWKEEVQQKKAMLILSPTKHVKEAEQATMTLSVRGKVSSGNLMALRARCLASLWRWKHEAGDKACRKCLNGSLMQDQEQQVAGHLLPVIASYVRVQQVPWREATKAPMLW